jgi:hypothetical protein
MPACRLSADRAGLAAMCFTLVESPEAKAELAVRRDVRRGGGVG